MRNLDKAEALLAGTQSKLSAAELVDHVELASEVDKAYLQRIIRENNVKGLDLINLKLKGIKIPQRHQAAFNELVQLLWEEAKAADEEAG